MDDNTNLQCHPELVEGIKKDIFRDFLCQKTNIKKAPRYFLCQDRCAQCDKAVVSFLFSIY